MKLKNESATSVRIKKVMLNSFSDNEDLLAVEEPLEIAVAYIKDGRAVKKIVSVTMRTPGNDNELAVGFLFTEGIIEGVVQVASVSAGSFEENNILVTLKDGEEPSLQSAERNFYTTSSCGVCGKSSIDAIKTSSRFSNIKNDIKIHASLFYTLPGKLRERQINFNSTGGLHASALFDAAGNFILLREDVGRHNALDKLIGVAFREGSLPLSDNILLLSGRASFELIQKATMAGIKIIAAIGAPSSLAVQMAKEAGITLVGFLKNETFNVYCGSERIDMNN